MKQGETRTLSMYLIVARKETNHNAYRHMLDMAWLMAEPEELPIPDDKKMWEEFIQGDFHHAQEIDIAPYAIETIVKQLKALR